MLSLCMIVRDEEKHVRKCIESVKGLVDEIVIVDTGSTDNTVKIAKEYGAKVYVQDWEDDFSKAKNEALRHAAGDWILSLDADEVISKKDHERIRSLLNDKNVMGYRLVQRTYQKKGAVAEWRHVERDCPEAIGAAGYIPSKLVRLFRREEDIRFQGVVHEVVEYSIVAKGGVIVETDIPIHHYGKMFDVDRIERKKRLYQKIGEKKAALNTGDARAHRDLGIQYIELGLFKEAKDVLIKAIGIEPGSAQAHFNLGVSYAGTGNKKEAKGCYREAINLDPGHIGAYNNLAGIFEDEGRHDEAQIFYEQAVKANPEHFIVFYNFGLFFERRSEWMQAIGCYEKALTINPRFFDAYYRLGQISIILGDMAAAVTLLKRAVEADPLHQDVSKARDILGKMVIAGSEHNPVLSLCMIVRNEEEYLPQCLESIKGFVDEIIIVDTGSSDGTVDIARRFGAKPIQYLWNNNFSEARNISLEHATGDWILMLDADETIAERDLKKIREIIRDRNASAYRLILRNYEHTRNISGWRPAIGEYEEERGYKGYGAVPLTRLFRRHHDVRYTGMVHETIEPSLQRLNIGIIDTEIPVHHYGCVREGQYVKRKAQIYSVIGESQLNDNPSDAKTMCDLGSHYISEGDLDRAEELLVKSIAIDPVRKRSHFNLGVVHAKREQYVDALKCFTDTLAIDRSDASARYNCGLMLEALGLPLEAFEQYREAVASNSGHIEALFRLASILSANGYSEDATAFYEKILAIAPDHKGAIDGIGNFQRGSIVFLSYGLEFDGNTLNERPLGGTETALINMAAELGRLGWNVRVFNNCPAPGLYDGVEYIHYREFDAFIRENIIDVFVAVRYPESFHMYIPARLRMLWSGDAPDRPFLKTLSDRATIDRIDRIITVSRWQADGFASNFNVPFDKFFVSTNGINPDYFSSDSVKRHPHRLIYSSTPFRGLDVLLGLFPEIRARIPDAELFVYSGMAVYQMPREQEERHFGALYKLADQPGVVLKGNVSQRELAEAMMSSSLLAYPNYYPETSCITAIEAMAAGIPVVTSRLGALPETLEGTGAFIEGDPRSAGYQKLFVNEVVDILTDRSRWKTISDAGRSRAKEIYPWRSVACRWDEAFRNMKMEKSNIKYQNGNAKSQNDMNASQMLSF